MSRVVPICLTLALFFTSCTKNPAVGPGPKIEKTTTIQWQKVDVGEFSISLPPGWVYEEKEGTDSKCGEFNGDGISLSYDLGMYSWRLDGIEGSKVEHLLIDGEEAKLVTGGEKNIAGVYFPEAIWLKDEYDKPVFDLALNVYGLNLTADQQKLVVQILKTIKFKN